ncbi:hypothetical protein HU200_067093 [Digitaria exilis]|uniref:GYF domain-containing protein n=1 Tax=Digitaria exilis TaxID=1010633 RepID=A0A835DW57_9POAL|nr:hypothetical protein HU200_067093 [Digitaria exilis]
MAECSNQFYANQHKPDCRESARDQVTDSLNILNEESSEGWFQLLIMMFWVADVKENDSTISLSALHSALEAAGGTHQVVDPLNVHNGEPKIGRTEGVTEQAPDSLSLLNNESSEVASKQGDVTCEAPSEAHEACLGGVTLDPAQHSQLHDTRDDTPTRAMDDNQKESDRSQQVATATFKGVEIINIDSDEDEDPPTVQHRPEGMNGDVHLEQCRPVPATMNGVLQPELCEPAPSTATMNNGAVTPQQCGPARAAKNGVSPHHLMWHYIDPQGVARGPFALVQLFHWKQSGFFNDDFRVWRAGQTVEQAILLADAFRMHLNL